MARLLITRAPASGKDFAVRRQALGISVRAVARQLGMSHTVFMRWESDLSPLSSERAEKWRYALATCAVERARELQRSGISADDLAGTELGALLTTYTAMIAAPQPRDAA